MTQDQKPVCVPFMMKTPATDPVVVGATGPRSMTHTRDMKIAAPLMSMEMHGYVATQCAGFQRATAFEVGLYATNLLGARFAEPAVKKFVEELCEAIRREKTAALMAVQANHEPGVGQ
jgi:hypothetical protein